MNSIWPADVAFQDDESISSWLIRAALENGCDPLILTGQIWPGWRVWTIDIDRGISDEKLCSLKRASTIGEEVILQAALSNDAKYFSNRPLSKYGIWPWVLGLGTRNRTHKGGTQFCPSCLAADSNCYFRRAWRFAWTTGCLIHQTCLIDRCFKCHQPIEPHKLEAIETRTVATCASCGFDLRDSPSTKAKLNSLYYQSLAATTVQSRTATIKDQNITVEQWFETCRYLINILRRSVLLPNSSISHALAKTELNTCEIKSEDLILPFELLKTEVRASILDNLGILLGRLDIFATHLQSWGMHNNSLYDGKKTFPSHIKLFISSNQNALDKKSGNTKKKASSSKPRSKTSILKSWSRLKRKYRVE